MYKVLVIDDDKLARNGLIAIVPWEKIGLTVVGDVANGMAALTFLKTNSVDLAIVDLSMPVLSGLDFIRESKKLYPALQYVVLSFHEGFEYVQSALRLGAIDYISKLRMEQEDSTEVFVRVAELMRRRTQEQAEPTAQGLSLQALEQLRQVWETLYWVYDDTGFEARAEELLVSGILPQQAERLMAWTATALDDAFGGKRTLPGRFDSPENCLAWLWALRESLYRNPGEGNRIAGCILHAVIFMKQHLQAPLKAETVGEAVGMSRGYFSTSFKKTTGFTFNDFLQHLRVLSAQKLLKEGAVLPGDVAAAVGYEDSKYFGRLFQRQTGMTCAAFWRQASIKDAPAGEGNS